MNQVANPGLGEPSETHRRQGIIEIGTRGVRLLIADASPLGIDRIVYSAGELSYLGEEVGPDGEIPATTTRRIKRIIAEYVAAAAQNGADDLLAIATESIRAAPNRAEFEAEIGSVVALQVLDNAAEAAFAFLASFEAFESELTPGATVLVVDQGGGSTELIYGALREDGLPVVRAALTLDFGTIALSRAFVASQTAALAWATISQQLRLALAASNYEVNFADVLQRPPDLAIALGSAITFYMRDEIASVEGRKPAMRDLHGRRVDPAEIVRYLTQIQPALEEMKLTPGDFAPESNEATILSGLVVYAAMAQKHGIREYRISRSGMRYGALSWRAGKRVLVELPPDSG